MPSPSVVRVWFGICRDAAIVALAAFLLVYEAVWVQSPNAYIVGAALTLLGIPPALRLDGVLRQGKDRE